MTYEPGRNVPDKGVEVLPGRVVRKVAAAAGPPALGEVIQAMPTPEKGLEYVERDDFLELSARTHEGNVLYGVRIFTYLVETFKDYIREGQTDTRFPLRFLEYPDTMTGKWTKRVKGLDIYSLRNYVCLIDDLLEPYDNESQRAVAYSKIPYRIGYLGHEFCRELVIDKLGDDAFRAVE